MSRHDPPVPDQPMFPEVNSLPRTQGEFSGLDGDSEIDRGQSRANVRGHVVITFAGVPENRVAIRRKPREETFQVTAHIGVGVFLDQQGRGSVTQMKRSQAGFEILLPQQFSHLVSKFIKAPASCMNRHLPQALP